MANQTLGNAPIQEDIYTSNGKMSLSWQMWFSSIVTAVQSLLSGNWEQQRTVTGNYTALPTDDILLVIATCTVSLPAAKNGKRYIIVCAGSGITVTVQATGTDNINGSSSVTLTVQYSLYRLKALNTGGWLEV